MIKEVHYRQAIICSLQGNSEYIYKDYADKEQLQKGIKRLIERRCVLPFRVAKIKITVEEIR